MENVICYICDSKAELYPSARDTKEMICSYCGKYSITGSFTLEGSFKDKTNFYKVSSYIREQNDLFQINPVFDYGKFGETLYIKDKKIKEKFDLMMHYLSLLSDNTQIDNVILSKCWIKDYSELNNLLQKGMDKDFIKVKLYNGVALFNKLTFDGLEYIENLESPNKFSKNIFVAFNFEDNLKEVFNEYLKQAIEEEGFNYTVVNQNNVDHNKSINDEIIVKLKSSRIVIADFTNHRNSVYFEAGFAMGMKIPIIWTCQEGQDKEMSFDTRQFPHIIWKDKDDLVKQVIDRIKVIL